MKASLKPTRTPVFFDFHNAGQSPSCCSPKSLIDLRSKRAPFSAKIPSNIKLKTEYMELGESSFMQQIQDRESNKELYQKYRENFMRIICDEDGNYLYTKVPQDYQKEISKEFENKGAKSLGVKEYHSFIEKKMRDLDNEKKEVEKFRNIEENAYFIRKKLMKKAGDNGSKTKKKIPKEFINSLKEGVYQKMNDFLNLKNKQEVINSSKQQLETVVREYNLIIEKLTKENQNLIESTSRMKLQVEETVELSDFLKRKNVLLIDQLKSLQIKYEEQLNMNSELEQFQRGMRLLNERFPNLTLEKLLNRHEILEETSMGLTRKISELEDHSKRLENEKTREINALQEKFRVLAENEKKWEKEIQEYQSRLNTQKFDHEDAQNYKEKYFVIFNRIIALFNHWNKKIRVYYSDHEELPERENVILEDPLHVLEVLDKMVRISVPEGLQKYLGKIIVSANKLQRNHFKQFVNERFDPEKLYERIDKKMESLTHRRAMEGTKGKGTNEKNLEKLFLE